MRSKRRICQVALFAQGRQAVSKTGQAGEVKSLAFQSFQQGSDQPQSLSRCVVIRGHDAAASDCGSRTRTSIRPAQPPERPQVGDVQIAQADYRGQRQPPPGTGAIARAPGKTTREAAAPPFGQPSIVHRGADVIADQRQFFAQINARPEFPDSFLADRDGRAVRPELSAAITGQHTFSGGRARRR